MMWVARRTPSRIGTISSLTSAAANAVKARRANTSGNLRRSMRIFYRGAAAEATEWTVGVPSIHRRLLRVIDDQHLDRTLLRFELEPQLLLQSRGERRPGSLATG